MESLESLENRDTLGIVGTSARQVSMEPRERKVIVVLQVFKERLSGNTYS